MLEAPEVEAHHHKSGHARIDLIIGCLAVLLSCTSIFIALRHGRTMEQLVAANSWPNLSYDTSNQTADGTRPAIRYDIRNTGVGPARIESFAVFYKGKPVTSVQDMLRQCCGDTKFRYSTSSVLGEVLPARDRIEFLSLREEDNLPEAWSRLDHARSDIRVRLCYCSVFDECWLQENGRGKARRVEQCTDTATPFDG